jgi:hypothetical protein
LYNVTYQLTPRTSTVLPSTAAAAAAAAVVVVVFDVFFVVVVFRFWVAALAC